jgi:aspartate aminotransferase/aromatic-amino-acid transaminase
MKMSKFQTVNPLPRLAKYVFREKFAADTRSDRMLVSTGAYKNEKGVVPEFECVQIATGRFRDKKLSKYYLDIAGYQPFRDAVNNFIFLEVIDLVSQGRVITTHTPGGTVALRIGADFIKSQWPDASIWVSDPTWGNHVKVFQTAGMSVRKYKYYNPATKTLELGKLLADIDKIPSGDVIFFQASTHNPTCIDPDPDEWKQIAKLVAAKGLLTFFDVAFFGFSKGIREDLKGLMVFCETVEDLMIAFSFSKSFALYNDRIGAFSILGSTKDASLNVYHHIRHLIRANYSNPPLDGAAVVTEVLSDPELFQMWESDITYIRNRIRSSRERIVDDLKFHGVNRDLSFILREKGLFTSFDLSQESIKELQNIYGIYISSTGRINVTSMTDVQLEKFCEIVSGYIP